MPRWRLGFPALIAVVAVIVAAGLSAYHLRQTREFSPAIGATGVTKLATRVPLGDDEAAQPGLPSRLPIEVREKAARPVSPSKPRSHLRFARASQTPRERAQEPPDTAPRREGTINISSIPVWAAVRIDGRPAGTTPTKILHVEAGSHSVEALPAGNEPPQRQTIVVEPDQTARVQFIFP